MTNNFFSNDIVKDAKVDEANWLDSSLDLESDSDFKNFFEVDRVLKWITDNNFKRTALQLPDSFLKYAYRLSTAVEAQCSDVKVYVLADTSYRSCCIDDVAVQHANCDSLVHFGESCLSWTAERIPILYVFGKFPVDVELFAKKWGDYACDNDLTDTHVYLLYDSVFFHHQEQLANVVRQQGAYVTLLELASVDTSTTNVDGSVVLGRQVPKSYASGTTSGKTMLLFVGSGESKLLPIWLMMFPALQSYVYYFPGTGEFGNKSSLSTRLLKKRLFLIEQLRDAKVVGLVVGTLQMRNYTEAIRRVRQLCKSANVKLYVFSIGKLNEAKLSNFASDIDAFIMLSCPFGIVLDSSDFYKPIVSMFEAEIALNSSKQWFASDGWTAEFSSFLKDEIKADETNEATVSLITGKLRATEVVDDDAADDKGRQVATYSAGDYFANRSWKGLDNTYKQDDSVELEQGLSGTPMSYLSEKKP